MSDFVLHSYYDVDAVDKSKEVKTRHTKKWTWAELKLSGLNCVGNSRCREDKKNKYLRDIIKGTCSLIEYGGWRQEEN